MNLTHEYIRHRMGYAFGAGCCWIRVYEGEPGDAPVVVCEELPEVGGALVSDMAAQLAAEVILEHFVDGLPDLPRPLLWIEHPPFLLFLPPPTRGRRLRAPRNPRRPDPGADHPPRSGHSDRGGIGSRRPGSPLCILCSAPDPQPAISITFVLDFWSAIADNTAVIEHS